MADRLVRAFDAVGELRPRAAAGVAAKLAMRLAQAESGRDRPATGAGDLAAILAAQAAVIAAVVAGSTAAVAATS